MLADIALRRRDYAEADLYAQSGRYVVTVLFGRNQARVRERA
jgi:hypothetical protein